MAKSVASRKLRQALNLVIILCCIMFLVFIAVGKMMDKKFEKASSTVQPLPALVEVDFGVDSLSKYQQGWSWRSGTKVDINARQIFDNWQALLRRNDAAEGRVSDGITLLLYLESTGKPVVCRVSQDPTGLNITFVETALQIHLPANAVESYFTPRIARLLDLSLPH